MGEFKHVSASQIKTYLDCPRKWYLQKIVGLPSPSSPSTELGKEIHSVIEAYFRDGLDIPDSDIGQIAKRGLEFLPSPSEDLSIELGIHEVLPIKESPVPIMGFIDLLHKGQGFVRIIDHKTTSSKKYTKTSKELGYDVQMNIYAKAVFDNMHALEQVEVVHVYYGTKSPAWSSSVSYVLTRQENSDHFDEIVKTIDKMKFDAIKEENEVEKNLESCFKFGGCPYRSECLLKRKEIDTMTQTQTQGLDLASKLGLTAPKPQNAQVAPATQVPQQVEAKIQAQIEKPLSIVPPYERRSLFIGCMPQKSNITPVSFYEAFREEIQMICNQFQVFHLSQVDYGKGWNAFQSLLASQSWSKTTTAIYIDPMSDEFTRVGSLLIANANTVIRRV
jgi:CRISPR/Cas system-associated exonuclease Cas4 (RecB family)